MVYLASTSNNLHIMLRNIPVQFYACFVQFLFSLFLILSVYFLGSMFFTHRIGLISAAFLSLTPIELLTANKIWADDMTAFFAVLSVIFYLYSLKKDRALFSLFAGISCGVAILAKMSAVYIVFVVLLFHLFENRNNPVNYANIKNFLFDKKLLYFLAGSFIVCAWWFSQYYSSFSPQTIKGYFKVVETWEPAKNWNRYFSTVSLRPWYSYFVLVPYQFPLYLLSYIFVPFFILRRKTGLWQSLIGKEARYIQFLLIWIAIVFMFLSLKPGKELRYMLIAYPAVAILTAYCLNLFYEWLKVRHPQIGLNLIRTLFISMVLLSLFYSLKIALPRVLLRSDIIPVPL